MISVKGSPGLLYFGLRRKYNSLFLQYPDDNSDEDYLQPLSLIAPPVLGSLASMMEKLHEFNFWCYENASTALVESEMGLGTESRGIASVKLMQSNFFLSVFHSVRLWVNCDSEIFLYSIYVLEWRVLGILD